MSTTVYVRNIMVGGNDPSNLPAQQPQTPPPSSVPQKQKSPSPSKPKNNKPKPLNQISGSVVSYQDNSEGGSNITRWCRAIGGKPYTKDGHYILIQITNPNNPNNLVQITLYGNISSGAIVNGNKITAHGKFDKFGQFIADSIHNDTTGVDVRPVGTISCNIIRIATIIPILIMAVLIVTGAIVQIAYAILGLVALVIIVYLVIKLLPVILLGRRRK